MVGRALARCLACALPWRAVQRLPRRAEYTSSAVASHIALRPYQEDCVRSCLEALARGCTRIGVSSPTGSGKTNMFTSLLSRIQPMNERATQSLILVNAIGLAQQAADRARDMFPHLAVEIEQGARHVASGKADITVATVQTLRQPSRLCKFDPSRFKCIIVDEAHHSTSASYLSVLAHFHKEIQPPSSPKVQRHHRVPIIGFSATFTRHDGVALGHVYEEIVFHKDFLEMIDDQWYVIHATYAGCAPCALHSCELALIYRMCPQPRQTTWCRR